MNHYDTVLPSDVASTEVSLDDSVPGHQHTFTIQHIIACRNRTTPVTTATFDFGQYITSYACLQQFLNFQEHKNPKIRASANVMLPCQATVTTVNKGSMCTIICTKNRCFCSTDKEYFQIQFGPIDYCLNWGVSDMNNYYGEFCISRSRLAH